MNEFLLLKDIANRTDPSGKIPAVVDLMMQECSMFEDMPYVTGNLEAGHKIIQVVDKPRGTYTGFNQGTDNEKSAHRQITFGTGSLTGRAEVDDKIMRNFTNAPEAFVQQCTETIQGLTQTTQNTLLYGETSEDPNSFDGFNHFYGKPKDPLYGKQLFNGGGTGFDNTSIYFVGWGPQTVFGITPKNSKAGIQLFDRGITEVNDENGKPYFAHVRTFELNLGLCIRDPRFVSVLHNVSLAKLMANPTELIKQMTYAMGLARTGFGSKMKIYVAREMHAHLQVAAQEKQNVNLTATNVEGQPVISFNGAPIRTLDALTFNNEPISWT